jgi:hypothetical protein
MGLKEATSDAKDCSTLENLFRVNSPLISTKMSSISEKTEHIPLAFSQILVGNYD